MRHGSRLRDQELPSTIESKATVVGKTGEACTFPFSRQNRHLFSGKGVRLVPGRYKCCGTQQKLGFHTHAVAVGSIVSSSCQSKLESQSCFHRSVEHAASARTR